MKIDAIESRGRVIKRREHPSRLLSTHTHTRKKEKEKEREKERMRKIQWKQP